MKTVSRFNITLNIPFSLICNVSAEFDGRPLNTAIEWILFSSESNGTSEVKEVLEMHECFPDALNLLSVNESSSGCEIDLGSVSDFSASGSGFSGSPPAFLARTNQSFPYNTEILAPLYKHTCRNLRKRTLPRKDTPLKRTVVLSECFAQN